LVYCLQGKILDVAVDLRKNSKTFGRVFRIILTPSRALFIPKWFAHGFSVLSKSALVYYKCSDYYYPELSERIRWDDETLKIDWNYEELVSNGVIKLPKVITRVEIGGKIAFVDEKGNVYERLGES
jgi:dTDP-4-dehydrorhamnose 3,5-epimerase